MSGYRQGARAALPIGIAAAAFAASFGLLARTAGMSFAAAAVMSATTFAGSAQFAATSILHTGGGAAAAIAAAVLLNARYAPMSIAVASGFEGGVARRLLESQLIVDESWAISLRGGRRFDVRVLVGAGAVLWLSWNSGTAIGAGLGDVLGDPKQIGLDAAFPALFLALLVPQLGGRRPVAAALTGAGIALVLLPFTPAGVPIVAASAACLLGRRPR